MTTVDNLPEIPSLADMDAGGRGGAWPNGWYRGTILPSYTGQSGRTFETDDTESQKGDSRNLRVIVAVANTEGEIRTIFHRVNYRDNDLTAERIAAIRTARQTYAKEYANKRWPDTDAQRTSLALASLGQLEKVMGRTFTRNGNGLDTTPLHNQTADVYLGTDEKGFNEVRQVAPSGTKVRS